ncbi:MAG: hypothetical protein ACXQTI_02220 [Candidatus Nezhaarchaeales archaeon]
MMTEYIKPILFVKVSLSVEGYREVFNSLPNALQEKFSDYLIFFVNLESEEQIFEAKVLSPYNQNEEDYKQVYDEVKSYLTNLQKTK